jgi:hypothetical protein
MTDRCQWCRFWGVWERNPGLSEETHRASMEHYAFNCRRRAPEFQGWPQTTSRDWCGEFERIATPAERVRCAECNCGESR